MRYPTPTSTPTDIVAAVKADHDSVERGLRTLESGGPPGSAERRASTRRVVADLVRDAAVKEAHLYPFMRRFLPDGDAVAARQVADNGRVEWAMKELESAEGDAGRFETLLVRLTAQVRARFAEEARIFPKLLGATTVRQRQEYGRRLQTAKRSAPTRPHPAGPDEPPMNRITHPSLGIADRVRDAADRRR